MMRVWEETRKTGLCVLFVGSLVTGGARAQDNPELGDIGSPSDDGSAEVSGGAEIGTSGTSSWSSSSSSSSSSYEDDSDDGAPAASGGSDHDAVIGHLGVGFFGTMDIPVMRCNGAPANCAEPSAIGVTAPTIGGRYWLDAGFGVELALGVNVTSPEFQTDVMASSGMTMRTLRSSQASILALGVHAGIPLVFAHSGHFVFQVVPQANFGFATGEHEGATADSSWDVSGLLIEVAAKVGAEVHFGFIDIPQLSLQGTLGLGLRVESRSAENNNSAAGSTTTHDQSATIISTGVDDAPWDIFRSAITAIYYF